MTEPTFSWGAKTDVGRVREVNEDSVHAQEGLFVVADGMGGHSGGEVASSVAIETVTAAGPPADIDELIEAVRSAHVAILRQAEGRSRPPRHGHHPVCAVARLADDRLGLVNVGDSRIYLFADDELTQVSEDHSLVGELHRAGHLSADEAAVPTRSATSSPGRSGSATTCWSTTGSSRLAPVTGSCCAATAWSTRSTTTRSLRPCGGSRTRPRSWTSWSVWPTSPAAGTTSRWSWCESTPAPTARPRSRSRPRSTTATTSRRCRTSRSRPRHGAAGRRSTIPWTPTNPRPEPNGLGCPAAAWPRRP